MKSTALPRFGDAIFVFILAACLLVGHRMLNLDGDLGRHLTLGRYMLDSGQVPTRDVLSFTRAGESRPAYEWLSQVVFAIAERALGLDGVVLLTGSIIAAAFLMVFIDARERGGGALIGLGLTVWAAAASSLHWLTRPHVFSFLFLAIWLLLLDRLRRGERRAIWQLPLVMLVWANFHGGFILGFIAWIAYALGWIIQDRLAGSQAHGPQLLLVGATSFGASVLTPGLGANWSAVLSNSNPYILSRTAETTPVALAAATTWPFLGLVFLALLLGIRCGRRLVISHALLLFIAAVLGVGIMRNIPLFCLAAVPILTQWERNDPASDNGFRQLEARMSAIDSGTRGYLWAPFALLLSAAALVVYGMRTHRGLYEFERQQFPVEAADWITKHELKGETFNDLNWGGYLLYRMWPESRVFIDSQSDFYGEQFIRDYVRAYQASGNWRSDLDGYGISSAILPPNSPLAIKLMGDPEWAVAFQDSTAVVLMRRNA